MGDKFAFLLPVIMLTFGAAFAVAARWGSRAASFWAGGYGCVGAAYLVPILLQDAPVVAQALPADALFLAGFCCLGQALLDYFGRSTRRLAAAGAAIATLSFAATAYAVAGMRSLRAELLLNDLTCAVLILLPLAAVARVAKRPIDRALVGVSLLVCVDNVVRTVVFNLLLRPEDRLEAYVGSTYAFVMQSTSGVFGLVFALLALAAVALRVVEGYRDAAERDPLTGLLNRRGFERATAGFAAAGGRPTSLVVCDIDHFKAVNDAFGHAAGDRVLQGFAETVRIVMPPDGAAARFGGEEFILFLPGPPRTAAVVAEVLRIAFAERDWAPEGVDRGLTASFGVAEMAPGDLSPFEAIARADAKLYAAKRAGRNRVVGVVLPAAIAA